MQPRRIIVALLATTATALVGPRPALRRASPLRSEIESEDPDGWTVTLSGLKYKDDVVGTGDAPADGSVVTVSYEGRLVSSGRVFDSSKGKGPIKFVLGEGSVIPAWDEGIATMKVGGKRTLYCPSRLAYGEYGSGGAGEIPPGADLEFDCELENVAEGALAVLASKLSIGYNLRTVILGLLVLSFILPVVFPDAGWLH
mmetsp:Transcript_19980/g.61573  ORF Transcript_19980/g.61573 Transcript_19980/m.61573 type:complete len:199 (+) Transcript_19980:382-978(+)